MSRERTSINRVSYTSPNGNSFQVERLSLADATASTARHVVDLVLATFGSQFEARAGEAPTPDRPLSAGAVALKYGGTDAITLQQAKMQQRIRRGGSYWLVWTVGSSSPEGLDGLINTTPSLDLASLNCYVGNILVAPDRQGEGRGTAGLYSALKYDGYEPDGKVALDSLSSNPKLDGFYRNRGLGPEPDVHVDPLEFPYGGMLPQTRYSGRIGDVISALEEQVPMLTTAAPE